MKNKKLFKFLLSSSFISTLSFTSISCEVNIIENDSNSTEAKVLAEDKKTVENENNETDETKNKLSGNARIIQEYKEKISAQRNEINEVFKKYNQVVLNRKASIQKTQEFKNDYETAKLEYDSVSSKVSALKAERQTVLNDLLSVSDLESEDVKRILGQVATGFAISDEDLSQISDSEFKNKVIQINKINNEYNKLTNKKEEKRVNLENTHNLYQTQLAKNEEDDLLVKELENQVISLQKSNADMEKWIKANSSKEVNLSFNSVEIKFKKAKKVIDENGVEVVKYEDGNNNGTDETDNQTSPDIPSFEIDLSKIPKYDENAHRYPSFVSEFTKVAPEEIYKEIYDRTFSFKYSFKEAPNGHVVPDTIYQGTAWILDYHKDQNSNKYKIFMASNMHVLAQFSNTLGEELDKKLDTYDPTGSTVVSFSLGKTKNIPTNFGDIPNNSFKDHISERGGDMVYFNSKNMGLESPKLIFAAIDYINDANLRSLVKTKQFKEKFKVQRALDTPSNDKVEAEIRKSILKYTESLNYIPYFSDFGVFEFSVDLDSPNVDETFKDWIRKAVAALDKYIARNKSTKTPNRLTSDLPFLSADYLSAARDKLRGKHLQYENISLPNAKDVYVAGYPKNNELKKTIWMQNNPTERHSTTITSYFKSPENNLAFSLSTGDFDSKLEAGEPNVQSILNKPVLNFYGVNYNIKFSSLYYGASGSVVYNEFGEIIGIYSTVRADNQFGNLLDSAGFTSLIQRTQMKLNKGILYPYNLIDGSDKTLYSRQTKSYRENLREIYKNGFDDQTKTTALFPDGF